MSYNERFAFLLGFETSLKAIETMTLKESDKLKNAARRLDKPIEQCGLMSAT
jgi:hypothetical protein